MKEGYEQVKEGEGLNDRKLAARSPQSSSSGEWVTDSDEDGEDGEYGRVHGDQTFEDAFAAMRRRAAKVDESTIFAKMPEPPSDVHCTLTSSKDVAVWFHFDHDQWQGGDAVTGWEIRRYRREARKNLFVQKVNLQPSPSATAAFGADRCLSPRTDPYRAPTSSCGMR